jgi:DNA ligase-1
LTAAAPALLVGEVTAFRELAGLCETLAGTRSRLELARRVADFLGGLDADEVRAAVRLLLGQAGRGETAVRGATLWPVLVRLAGAEADAARAWQGAVDFGAATERLLGAAPNAEPPPAALSLTEVEDRIRALATARGRGSRAAKERQLVALFERLLPVEAKYVAKNLTREMRTGVAEGVVIDALGLLAEGGRAAVARAHLLEGDLAEVAARVLAHRGRPLPPSRLEYFRPVRPMLAHTAENATQALASFEGRAGVEEKLDGARVQVHVRDGDCRLYSRRLQDLTASLPDVVEVVRTRLAVPAAILEGEVVPVDAAGRILPFQELMRRFRRVKDVERSVRDLPVQLRLFDVLQVGDEPLFDEPYGTRWQALERVRGSVDLVGRTMPSGAAEAEAFYARALAAGLEGVMVKGLDAPYAPGVRGRGWLKVKRAVSVDLVIVAADRGYGRRHGWLSNYHLAARDEDSGRLEPVGKTFKGLTDAEFESMTARLSALALSENGPTVFVEPRVVVEVLFTDLQRSPTYAAGLALRFARIARIRDDKAPEDADTLQHLRALYAQQEARGRGET